MDNVLITGGHGFLGRHLTPLLKDFNIICPTKVEVNWATGQGVSTLNFKPDVIVHLLAIYGGLDYCVKNRARMAIVNQEINANVFRYILNKKPKKVITIGSSCEYPGYNSGILNEGDLGNGQPHESIDHYAYSKLMQLETCKAFYKELGIGFEHIIPSSMYGPGDHFNERSHVIPALIQKFANAKGKVKMMGTGAAVRDFVYVKDIAELISFFTMADDSQNQPLNAGWGYGVSVKDLTKIISELTGFQGEIEWGQPSEDGCRMKVLDTKNLNFLGWKPATYLETGLAETIKWYKNAAKS